MRVSPCRVLSASVMVWKADDSWSGCTWTNVFLPTQDPTSAGSITLTCGRSGSSQLTRRGANQLESKSPAWV